MRTRVLATWPLWVGPPAAALVEVWPQRLGRTHLRLPVGAFLFSIENLLILGHWFMYFCFMDGPLLLVTRYYRSRWFRLQNYFYCQAALTMRSTIPLLSLEVSISLLSSECLFCGFVFLPVGLYANGERFELEMSSCHGWRSFKVVPFFVLESVENVAAQAEVPCCPTDPRHVFCLALRSLTELSLFESARLQNLYGIVRSRPPHATPDRPDKIVTEWSGANLHMPTGIVQIKPLRNRPEQASTCYIGSSR